MTNFVSKTEEFRVKNEELCIENTEFCRALEEALELARFELRYQILQQAAFKNLFAYRPRVLMKQIEGRVRKVKVERTHHITALNRIGSVRRMKR